MRLLLSAWSSHKCGVELIPIELPEYPAGALQLILIAEAAAAFDQLTLTDQDDLMN
ncbi:MAG: hypothetical protein WD059_06200 [Balneolaceae bacterium]